MKITKIPIEKLRIDNMNIRKEIWISDDELVKSIKTQGVIEPLIVRKQNNKFGIVAGSRRFNASFEAGLKEVPCIIRNELSDMDALIISLQENLQRRNVNSVEISDAISTMWNMMGDKSKDKKYDAMERKFGIKRRTLTDYLNIAKAAPEFKELLATGTSNERLDIKTASAIVSGKAGDSTSKPVWNTEEQLQVAHMVSKYANRNDRLEVVAQLKKQFQEKHDFVKNVTPINSDVFTQKTPEDYVQELTCAIVDTWSFLAVEEPTQKDILKEISKRISKCENTKQLIRYMNTTKNSMEFLIKELFKQGVEQDAARN